MCKTVGGSGLGVEGVLVIFNFSENLTSYFLFHFIMVPP